MGFDEQPAPRWFSSKRFDTCRNVAQNRQNGKASDDARYCRIVSVFLLNELKLDERVHNPIGARSQGERAGNEAESLGRHRFSAARVY